MSKRKHPRQTPGASVQSRSDSTGLALNLRWKTTKATRKKALAALNRAGRMYFGTQISSAHSEFIRGQIAELDCEIENLNLSRDLLTAEFQRQSSTGRDRKVASDRVRRRREKVIQANLKLSHAEFISGC